jgi:hypothetical protein
MANRGHYEYHFAGGLTYPCVSGARGDRQWLPRRHQSRGQISTVKTFEMRSEAIDAGKRLVDREPDLKLYEFINGQPKRIYVASERAERS